MIYKTKLLLYVLMTNLLFINYTYATTDYTNLTNNHEIIAKYENGGKGYEAFEKDTYGGYSYGKWQISTKRVKTHLSTFDLFLSYLKKNNNTYYHTLMNAGGYQAAFNGNTNFTNQWKKLCSEDSFRKTYDDFILNTQVLPAYKKMEKIDNPDLNKIISWGLSDNVIQAALHSVIIQHGPNGGVRLIKYTCKEYTSDNKEKFLENLYKARARKYPKYKRRYAHEYNDLKSAL